MANVYIEKLKRLGRVDVHFKCAQEYKTALGQALEFKTALGQAGLDFSDVEIAGDWFRVGSSIYYAPPEYALYERAGQAAMEM